jgi:hypothetical protein
MVMNVIGVSLKYAALAVKKKYFEIFFISKNVLYKTFFFPTRRVGLYIKI